MARHEQTHTVVVLPPDASDRLLTEAFSRLCGELHMYGLRIAQAEPKKDALGSEDVLAAAQAAAAVAVIGLVRSADSVSAEVWVIKGAAANSVRLTVTADEEDAPSLLAMRAVDVLRGSLREGDGHETATETRDHSAAVAPQPTHAENTGALPWSVGAAAATVVEAGRLGAGIGPRLELDRQLSRRFAVALSVAAPVLGQTFSESGTKVAVSEEMATVTLLYRVFAAERLTLEVFQGLGVLYMTVHGEVSPPALASNGSAWFLASSTGGRAVVPLSRTLSLRFSAAALLLLPSPVVDVTISSYHVRQPLFLATGGLHVSL